MRSSGCHLHSAKMSLTDSKTLGGTVCTRGGGVTQGLCDMLPLPETHSHIPPVSSSDKQLTGNTQKQKKSTLCPVLRESEAEVIHNS